MKSARSHTHTEDAGARSPKQPTNQNSMNAGHIRPVFAATLPQELHQKQKKKASPLFSQFPISFP